jgi:hypothetical protein
MSAASANDNYPKKEELEQKTNNAIFLVYSNAIEQISDTPWHSQRSFLIISSF